MQKVYALAPEGLETLILPPEDDPIGMGRICWGRSEELCTPAYWAAQAWMLERTNPDHYRLGRSLEDETLACLLGGHGIPAEVGLAAYRRLVAARAVGADLRHVETVDALLRIPLSIGSRSVRYRFAKQKARYVAAAMSGLGHIDGSLGDQAFRDALIEIPGIGPKTASWIVRNWRGSDEVSILDIHILRAGRIIGIFAPSLTVERHYRDLENAYLEFARCIGRKASILDSAMWALMRDIPLRLIKDMTPAIERASPKQSKQERTPQFALI